MNELEKLIFESKMKGVWSGYVRKEYGENTLNELLESGHFVKIKTGDSLFSPNQGVPMWAIVKTGFHKRLVCP